MYNVARALAHLDMTHLLCSILVVYTRHDMSAVDSSSSFMSVALTPPDGCRRTFTELDIDITSMTDGASYLVFLRCSGIGTLCDPISGFLYVL